MGDLIPGERVLTRSGHVAVLSVISIEDSLPVYNIEVESERTYEVTALGILVHNNDINGSERYLKLRKGEKEGNKVEIDELAEIRLKHSIAPIRGMFASKAGAFNKAKELAGISTSQQATHQWTIRGSHKDFPSGATIRHPSNTHHGRIYEYEVVGPGGEKQYKYMVVHENDPTHGGIGHVHAAQSKAGPTHRLKPGESYRNIDSREPISFDRL